MDKLLLMDFDDTMFDTSKFKTDLVGFWDEAYKLDFKRKYELAKNEHGAYDYISHLRLEENATETEILISDFLSHFSGRNYLFDDVGEFLKRKKDSHAIKILTLGFDNFQRLKYQICADLEGIEMTPIETDKAVFLGKNLQIGDESIDFAGGSYTEITFVDDKPSSFIADNIFRTRFNQVRIIRPHGKYSGLVTPEGVLEITSLTQI